MTLCGCGKTGKTQGKTGKALGKNDRLEILENSSILTFCHKNNIFLQIYIA